MPPRGLDPRGLILVDKPAGPSSYSRARSSAFPFSFWRANGTAS